MQQTIQSKI